MTIDSEKRRNRKGAGMATKEQERKALEQIRKILAGLGNDSYVAAAIDQMVLNMAEENINNDWLFSPSDRINSLEKAESAARVKAQEAAEKLESMKASRDEWQRKAEREDGKAEEYKKALETEYARNTENAHQFRKIEEQNEGETLRHDDKVKQKPAPEERRQKGGTHESNIHHKRRAQGN